MKKNIFGFAIAAIAILCLAAAGLEISSIGYGPTLPTNHTSTSHKVWYETDATQLHWRTASAWVALPTGPVTSSNWSNTATIASSQDTLLNSNTAYGHFQRVGSVVNFTLRFHVALGSAGGANTVYINPPIASNFTQEASDVIGTATLDRQAQSTANVPRQRALLFASTSDDKIGVAYDPVASLSFPENRVYISVSGSYLIQ
jgi:hypothetical protein